MFNNYHCTVLPEKKHVWFAQSTSNDKYFCQGWLVVWDHLASKPSCDCTCDWLVVSFNASLPETMKLRMTIMMLVMMAMMMMMMMVVMVVVVVVAVVVVVVIPLYPGWLSYRSQRYSLQQHQHHQEDLRLWDGVLRYASDLQPGDVCWWGLSAARFVFGATWTGQIINQRFYMNSGFTLRILLFLGSCIYRHAYLLAWNICISTCASYIDR